MKATYILSLHFYLLLLWLYHVTIAPVQLTWGIVLALLWTPVLFGLLIDFVRGFRRGYRRRREHPLNYDMEQIANRSFERDDIVKAFHIDDNSVH